VRKNERKKGKKWSKERNVTTWEKKYVSEEERNNKE
jgi:hypothetical protein